MNTDRISKLQRRAIDLRGKLEEIGPVIFGTIAKKTQKCHHKDGSVRICPSPSVITFAKTQGRGQARIPREAEKKVREYVAAGKKYAKMRDELDAVNSELVFLGVSKKLLMPPVPRFANLQAILAEESETETGVVGEGDVSADGDVSGWREVRPRQPDGSHGGVDTVEHRGGLRAGHDAGLPAFPAHCARKRVRAGDAACPCGRPRPVRTAGVVEGCCDATGGNPPPAGTYRGAGTKSGKVKNSTPIADCLTPHPWVRFFQTHEHSKRDNGCHKKKSHPLSRPRRRTV